MSEAHLDLEHVIFIGRTFEEYMRMFDLKVGDLTARKILDCPAGACSFTAHGSKFGAEVTAVDVMYDLSSSLLAEKGMTDIEIVREGMRSARDEYIWDEFKNLDGLIQTRRSALSDFIKDYEDNNTRYVKATLPQLPFSDEQFDLVLSANFLFTYAGQFDYAFHHRTLLELLRVTSSEVRIYPLVSVEGSVQPYLPQLTQALLLYGYKSEVVSVPYEFQRGTNKMLRIIKETR